MNRKITAALLAALMLLTSTAAIAAPEDDEKQYSGEYTAFEQISDYVSKAFIDDTYTTEDVMAQGLSKLLENNEPVLVDLLKATLESMDDYSEFYTAEEYKEYQDQLNNTFYGIGITMEKKEDSDYVEVTGFTEGNDNAQNAGLLVGDLIYKVDGEYMTGLTTRAVRDKVVGEEGTTVEITVLRGGEELTFPIKRVAVSNATVSSAILEGNIGYIRITSFTFDTAGDFVYNLETMRENNVKKIILDLRDNGGGYVDSAIDVAEEIVPKGKIVDVKFRNKEYDATYTSQLSKKEFDFVVLVNEYTASAAEILASAMQDSKAAKLVGTKTYGKAVIQNLYPLQNGSVFKLTAGQYITRNGREINKIGLEPDVYVENVTQNVDLDDYTPFDLTTRNALGSSHNNVKAAKELKAFGLLRR